MDATNSGTPAGKIVTFYSYKGGTGRSMALANIAWILAAKRQRVLVLDWDLEAPGLHRYFRPFLIDKYLTSSDGLIDFVMEFADQVIAPPGPSEQPSPDWDVLYANITRYALSVNFGEFPPPGKIDLIPAGRQGPAYATRVSSFNWQNLYDRLGGGAFFEAVKAHMRRDYDYILIDSRTGVSDTAGICTVQMPDALVVCFTYNNQSMEGAAAVAHSSVQGRRKFLGTSRNNAFNVFPVPTRVEQAEQQKLGIRQRYARRLFNDLLAPGIDRDAYWSSVEVPYVPFHGYEETLAPFTDDPNDTKKILRAMINIAAYLTEVRVEDFTFTFPISPELKSEVLFDFAATPGAADTDQSVAGPTKETALEELVRVAEAHYLHLPPEQQEEARRVWTRLVHVVRPDEGVGHSRQRINLQAFGATATPLVRALAQTTLLSLTRDDTSGEETVVIDSEALIGSWSRLRGWLDKDLDFLFWRQRLRDPIQDWEASGYKNDFLLRGAPLRTAQQWAGDHGADLNEAEQAFINRAVQMSLAASSHSDDRRPRAAILRPFGRRKEIDFDEVERSLILPALERLGISGRSIQILEAGNIRVDMFQQLVAAQIVIADVSIDNANVFYALGLRHSLQPNRTFLLRARSRKGARDRSLRDEVPFDLRTDRYLEYEPDTPAGKLEPLLEALRLTLANDQSDSPVFQMLPDLEGPDLARLLPVPRARARTTSQIGGEGVVPFREDIAGLEVQRVKLSRGGLNAGRIVTAVEMSGDRETSGRSRGPNEAEDLLVAVERLAGPVFGDLGEEAMLDGVPLGRARRIVSHGEGETEDIRELELEFGFPGAGPAAITAAGIPQQEQPAGLGIPHAPVVLPPARNRARREGGCIVRDTDGHTPAIRQDIVNAMGNGHANGGRAEVVIVDETGRVIPSRPRVLEGADQFALFGVDADDGQPPTLEAIT